MNEINLNEIQSNLEKGVLVSRSAWASVLEHAQALTEQHTKTARLIVEKLGPRYVTDHDLNAWVCQCCAFEVKGNPEEAPNLMPHAYNCEYLGALEVYNAAVAQNSGAGAFNVGHEASRPLAKDRWDSDSVEARFHKSITFLTKREQGYVMGAFRKALTGKEEA